MSIKIHLVGGILSLLILISIHFYLCWRIGSTLFANRSFSRKRKFGMGVLFFLLFFAWRWGLLTLVFSPEWDYNPASDEMLSISILLLLIDWITIFLFTFCAFLIVDILTGFGFWLKRYVLLLRRVVLVVALLFSTIAVVQAKRQPVITEYEVSLAELPAELDGTVAVLVSDTHLGQLIGSRWIARLVGRIDELHPDLVLLLGDFFDAHSLNRELAIPELRKLSAPLGAWAVLGNHDSERDRTLEMYREAGFKLLRQEITEIAPGLTLAGVDFQLRAAADSDSANPVKQALAGNPDGAVIFMSHDPLNAELAARLGADLMLSGHTHGGQVWPFGYLVKMTYPLFEGEYDVDGMSLIVSRGAGTWGPRMRLWQRGEIVKLTLRAK